ncbi:universal stress protein [Bradyrhizobium genosp. P]|uniref:universal stress protein n=1 Tax=Bradyrhizobium genosp. P TaxID=83641 RepID=UPI003CEDC4CC
MSIDLKTITVFLDATASGRKRALHAAALAQRWGAHLVGVHVTFAGVTLPPSMSYARGREAAKHVIAYEHQLDAAAEAAAAVLGAQFQAMCARLGLPGEFRPIGRGWSAEDAVANSLHSDLVVVGHPMPNGLPEHMSPERILLASGVPLLVVPNTWEGETIGSRILVGWNATREARRAVSDSLNFLVAAKSVTVLVIDPGSRPQHGDAPGADIAIQLARHGAHVDVERVSSSGIPVAQVIVRYALKRASDLLVIGAYSHARLKEVLFGGVTRTLLARMPVPVLISR